jgi:hypothetical protein
MEDGYDRQELEELENVNIQQFRQVHSDTETFSSTSEEESQPMKTINFNFNFEEETAEETIPVEETEEIIEYNYTAIPAEENTPSYKQFEGSDDEVNEDENIDKIINETLIPHLLSNNINEKQNEGNNLKEENPETVLKNKQSMEEFDQRYQEEMKGNYKPNDFELSEESVSDIKEIMKVRHIDYLDNITCRQSKCKIFQNGQK